MLNRVKIQVAVIINEASYGGTRSIYKSVEAADVSSGDDWMTPEQIAVKPSYSAEDLDGLDFDWEDNGAMDAGTGEEWLIECTKAARTILPVGKYLITHAPQAPYFIGKPRYPNGGYVTVHA